jgi:hypothetical protein
VSKDGLKTEKTITAKGGGDCWWGLHAMETQQTGKKKAADFSVCVCRRFVGLAATRRQNENLKCEKTTKKRMNNTPFAYGKEIIIRFFFLLIIVDVDKQKFTRERESVRNTKRNTLTTMHTQLTR